MKKSLLALALLGAFTASAFAEPSVTLYGRIDTGLVYTHKNLDNTAGSTDTFSMDSGVTTGSRWGLKGSEDIGNAKVGFVLESGFNSDDGTSGQNNRLFGREAQVNISGAYGTLYAGRLASIASDSGSIGYLGDVSAFPSAYGFVGNQQGSTGTAYGRYDNTLAYETPTFGGLQGAIMYSFKGDTKASDSNVANARENSGDADRYLAAGLRYKAGKAAVVLTGDMTMYGNDAANYGNVDNGYSFILGGNYDFGVAKAFAKVTYFDNQVNVLDSFDLISDSRDLKKAEALNSARTFRPSAATSLLLSAIVMPRTSMTAPTSSSAGTRLSATPMPSASARTSTVSLATPRKRRTLSTARRAAPRLVSASFTSSDLLKETGRSSPFC